MVVFYDSLVENTNCWITVVFDSCFSFFLIPKVSCFEIVPIEKVYFLRKKSCTEKTAAFKKKRLSKINLLEKGAVRQYFV